MGLVMHNSENKENFRDKYVKSGVVGRYLVNNFYSSVEQLLGETRGLDSVLEVGIGEGFSTERIRKMLDEDIIYKASEFDRDLLQSARARNPSVDISQESIYDLARDDNEFDLVICLEVLEHLDNPEEALAELLRVSGKYILVSVPREPIWRALNMARGKYLRDFGNTPGHIQHWSRSSFAKFVSVHFNLVEVSSPLPWTIILAKL